MFVSIIEDAAVPEEAADVSSLVAEVQPGFVADVAKWHLAYAASLNTEVHLRFVALLAGLAQLDDCFGKGGEASARCVCEQLGHSL